MSIPKINILIVDDEPAIRLSLTYIFTRLGHTVQSAEDGFTALFAMTQYIPDIMITDLNMPGMSGFRLLAIVRRRFPQIHTIAMSGAYSGSSTSELVFADAYHEKGSGPKELLEMVERMSGAEVLQREPMMPPPRISMPAPASSRVLPYRRPFSLKRPSRPAV